MTVVDATGKSQLLCVVFGICSTFMKESWAQHTPLKSIYEWNVLEFDYPSSEQKQSDINRGYYVQTIPAPIDVDVYYGTGGTSVFVTIPRFQVGSPITLGIVRSKGANGNPILSAFPDWSWHQNPESCQPNRLISVYRVKIDKCGRLWVLDTGKYGDAQTCPPQLLAFDLRQSPPRLLYRYTIPSNLLELRSILVTPIVDTRDPQCRDTFVYIADCQTYSIIVYDAKHDTAWKVTDKTMYPYPNYGTYNIQGDQFDLMDGVLGMDLEPHYGHGQDRRLFYHAMSSPTENWVYTSQLRNRSRFEVDLSSSPDIFHTYASTRPSQSCAMAIDKDGISYFGIMAPVTLNCWNTKSAEYGKFINTVVKDTQRLQFISGIKVINNPSGVQELWLLSSRFQKVATGTITASETNFRIQGATISELLTRTNCQSPGGSSGGFGSSSSSSSSGTGGGYGFKPTFSFY